MVSGEPGRRPRSPSGGFRAPSPGSGRRAEGHGLTPTERETRTPGSEGLARAPRFPPGGLRAAPPASGGWAWKPTSSSEGQGHYPHPSARKGWGPVSPSAGGRIVLCLRQDELRSRPPLEWACVESPTSARTGLCPVPRTSEVGTHLCPTRLGAGVSSFRATDHSARCRNRASVGPGTRPCAPGHRRRPALWLRTQPGVPNWSPT